VALLTSMHVYELYKSKQGSSKELEVFLAELKNNQKRWRKSLGLSDKQAKADYALMLWCDRCSLILCQDEIPASERRLEVQRGPTGTHHFLWQREDKTLGVEDWPFEDDSSKNSSSKNGSSKNDSSKNNEFSVSVEVHQLKQLRFESEAELRKVLREAEIEFRSWTFRK
jgi:Protein of unknown function (DUF3891)